MSKDNRTPREKYRDNVSTLCQAIVPLGSAVLTVVAGAIHPVVGVAVGFIALGGNTWAFQAEKLKKWGNKLGENMADMFSVGVSPNEPAADNDQSSPALKR